jgi:hypothetical protein
VAVGSECRQRAEGQRCSQRSRLQVEAAAWHRPVTATRGLSLIRRRSHGRRRRNVGSGYAHRHNEAVFERLLNIRPLESALHRDWQYRLNEPIAPFLCG